VGLQLVGRKFEEQTLLRASYAFQHAVNWDRLMAVDAAGR
jgi:Asp-tRNA(Asn)/Glu-tRNA(Gln) amidotransferase A subunit family amidase